MPKGSTISSTREPSTSGNTYGGQTVSQLCSQPGHYTECTCTPAASTVLCIRSGAGTTHLSNGNLSTLIELALQEAAAVLVLGHFPNLQPHHH